MKIFSRKLFSYFCGKENVMAYDRQRKPARRSSDYVPFMAQASRSINATYNEKSRQADYFDNLANRGREKNGAYMRKADQGRLRTTARQIRHDASLRGNDYQYGTREQVQAQHNARYRNIRRSFGMSAG